METKATAIIAATNQNILTEIDRLGTSKSAVARNAGIADTTFARKIKGKDGKNTFTLAELGAIAEAMNLTLGDILPRELIELGATG